MNPTKATEDKNVEAEVVIIGAGGAGLAAAVAAAENGANNIILLETRRVPGGNAVFAMGIFAAESRLQKSLGVDARRDVLFKRAMKYAHWRTNPRLIRALVDKSGETIRWLEEKGVKVDQIKSVYPNQVPLVSHFTSGPGRTGAKIVRVLAKNCESLGVRLLYQTRAKKLLTNTSNKGRVIGVLAEAKGREIRITGKSIIIATGGFLGNKDLLKKYLPDFNEKEFHYAGIPHQGDGLRMATETGASTEGLVVLEMEGPSFPWSSDLFILTKQPNTIWVNKKGERFTDEAIFSFFPESANSLYRQPDKIAYILLDEKIKQIIFQEELNPFEKLIAGDKSWTTRADKDLRLQSDKGRVNISGSLSEIAKWIGANPKVLKDTIDEYNSFCDQGHDDIFVKDPRYLLPLRNPPYYAIQCCVNLLTTHGGIKINHHMEVLDHQDNPIPGLYAVGNDTGGMDSDTYDINLSGHSFGFAINSGRIAGENAAKFALESRIKKR